MINDKKILAVVPARGGSKDLPGKNIIQLAGKPLIGWPIHAAKASKYIDRLLVSTDDMEIANIARSLGAEVPFLRPKKYATDKASSFSFIKHAIEFMSSKGFRFDYFILLEPTSPLTETEDIDKALEKLEEKRKIADSLVGVCKAETSHPFFCSKINEKGLLEPIMLKKFPSSLRRQDLENIFFFDGSIYISDIPVLLEKKSFYHDRTLPIIFPRWKSFEVDEIFDLFCIEAIIKNIDKLKVKMK